jgi:hypothetical protein
MSDPADTLATNIQYIGHGLRVEAKTGQNGGLNPSVIKTNEKLPRSTVAKSIIAADSSVSPAPWVGQTRKVSAAPLRPAHAQKSPTSPAKIPSVLDRSGGGSRPSVVPTKRGNAKR